MIRNHIRTANNPDGHLPVYYDLVDPNKIFGMVGRCGGGHNTVWADWSTPGRIARANIVREFEAGMNEICGHYDRLEASILEHGMRDPIIVTCGWPVKRHSYHMPPEITRQSPPDRLLLEDTTGGSRLWVAQKHNIPVPCIINDYSRRRFSGRKIQTRQQAIELFGDEPLGLLYTARTGVTIPFDPTKTGFHMGGTWREDQMVIKRAPLWVKLMNKYGYYVSRLNSQVNKILLDACVVQPAELKEKFDNERHGVI